MRGYRKEGLYINKRKLLENEALVPIKKRKLDVEGKVIFCSQCKGSYIKDHFYKHQKRCDGLKSNFRASAMTSSNEEGGNTTVHYFRDEEIDDLYDGMIEDDVTKVVRNDEDIKAAGEAILRSAKQDKIREATEDARRNMRRLANLVIET